MLFLVKIQWNNRLKYVKIPMEFIAYMRFSVLNRNIEKRTKFMQKATITCIYQQ